MARILSILEICAIALLSCLPHLELLSLTSSHQKVSSWPADSLTVDHSRQTQAKLFLTQKRMAVATAWLTSISGFRVRDSVTGKTYSFEYQFQSWIETIEKNLPTDVSVSRLSEIMENESASTFKDFDVLVKAGGLKEDKSLGATLVRYYVAGYERDIPMVYKSRNRGRLANSAVDWPTKNPDTSSGGR